MRKTIETILATLIVPGGAVLLIPYLILTRTAHAWPVQIGFLQVLSLVGGITGISMVIWVSYAFVQEGNGTPIPIDPPEHFVANGLFKVVRNPMYFGAIFVLFSEVIFFGSLWLALYACLLWLALHTFLVVFEEPQLKNRFGEPYQHYLESTPRWIPRLSRRAKPNA